MDINTTVASGARMETERDREREKGSGAARRTMKCLQPCGFSIETARRRRIAVAVDVAVNVVEN